MPAWPGGDCPDCGEQMPPNLIRCQTCRAWLNADLQRDDPAAPEFVPLPEVPASDPSASGRSTPGPSGADCPIATPVGHYVVCPACERELRVADQYVGCVVACRFCSEPLVVGTDAEGQPSTGGRPAVARRKAFFLDCPHCREPVRASQRFMGQRVLCNRCDGRIAICESPRAAAAPAFGTASP